MALSGSIKLTSSKAWRGKISWSATQNIAGNYSDVYVYASMWKTDGHLTSSNSYTSGTITIDGETYSLIGYQEFKDEVCIFEDTIRVYHEADGSKSFTISLSCKGQAGTSLSGYTLSGSGVAVMDLIARTSTFSATDAAIGSVSAISIYRQSSALSHRIKVEFGSLVGYVTSNGGFTTSVSNISSDYSTVGFVIPSSFYNQIPNSKEGNCKLTLYTLSGGVVVGDAVSITIHITTIASRCQPILAVAVNHDNSGTASLTGSNTAFIRHYSNAICTLSATAQYGASIVETWAEGNYTKTSDGKIVINQISSETLKFYAKDSRGYTSSISTKVTLVPYIALTNNATAGRPNPTDGSAYINFSGDYFNGSFGAVNNTLSVRYQITHPDGRTEVVAVTPSISNNSYSAYIPLSGFDYTKSYNVRVIVEDRLKSITKDIVLKQGIPVFDWGSQDFQFHVLVGMDGNRVTDLGDPIYDTDAVPKWYADNKIGLSKRQISGTKDAVLAVGGTHILTERIIPDKGQISPNPMFCSLAYAQAFLRLGGSTGHYYLKASSVTETDNGLIINFAYFDLSDDGVTMTLSTTRRVTMTSSGVTVEKDVPLRFSQVVVIQ